MTHLKYTWTLADKRASRTYYCHDGDTYIGNIQRDCGWVGMPPFWRWWMQWKGPTWDETNAPYDRAPTSSLAAAAVEDCYDRARSGTGPQSTQAGPTPLREK